MKRRFFAQAKVGVKKPLTCALITLEEHERGSGCGEWGRFEVSGFAPRTKKEGGAVAARKSKKALSMQEELALILAEEGRQRQMLTAVVDKAIGGDMKAVEFVREILGEKKNAAEGLVIKLDKSIEEMAK